MSTRKRKKKTIQQFPSRKLKKPITKEDRRIRNHSALFIGSVILFILHDQFIAEETIGHDTRYYLYILGIPTLVGLMALIVYQWELIKGIYQEIKGFQDFVLAFVFLPIGAIVISFMIFANMAIITWDYLNTKEAEQHMPKVIHCQVESFNERRGRGTHNSIDFTFNNNSESFKVNYEYIKPYLSANPDDYKLEVVTQKGIWNYYVVKAWYLKKH